MRTWPRVLSRCALAVVLLLQMGGAGGQGRDLSRTAAPQELSGPSPAGPRPQPAFRLELRPQLDTVFPDAQEFQRVLDRAQELAAAMRRVGDDFARAVQEALREVNLLSPAPGAPRCPPQVAQSYARAQALGQEFLRIGREFARHHEQVRELDRLGDGVGLTPDYRGRVQKVLRSYDALLGDYREMKAAFHDQLGGELRFAGCEVGQRLVQAPPRDAGPPKERPRPAAPSQEARGGILFYVDNSRCRRGHLVLLDGQVLGEVGGAARAGFRTSAGPHELCLLSQAEPPGTRVASVGTPPSPEPGGGEPQRGAEPASRDGGPRDAAAPQVEQDGELQSAGGRRCGEPGTVRRSYLHDGWTIALRCE